MINIEKGNEMNYQQALVTWESEGLKEVPTDWVERFAAELKAELERRAAESVK